MDPSTLYFESATNFWVHLKYTLNCSPFHFHSLLLLRVTALVSLTTAVELCHPILFLLLSQHSSGKIFQKYKSDFVIFLLELNGALSYLYIFLEYPPPLWRQIHTGKYHIYLFILLVPASARESQDYLLASCLRSFRLLTTSLLTSMWMTSKSRSLNPSF